MKQKAVLFLMILLLGNIVLAATGPNLIYNPSMEISSINESLPDGWLSSTITGSPEFHIDRTQTHSGNASLKIVTKGATDWGGWNSSGVPVKPGMKIRAGLHYKVTGSPIAGSTATIVIIQVRESDHKSYWDAIFNLSLNAGEWTAASTTAYEVPADTAALQISVTFGKMAGTMNIDDVWLCVEGDEDLTPPLPPEAPWANRSDARHADLTWKTPSAAGDGDLPIYYHIYRSEERGFSPNEETLITSVFSKAENNSFTDITIEPGRKYYYYIASMDKMGNLANSQLLVISEEAKWDGNLLINASFEEWNQSGYAVPWQKVETTLGAIEKDTNIKMDGNSSMRITNKKDDDYNRTHQDFTSLKKNTQYYFSGWVKTKDVVERAGSMGVRILINGESSKTLARSLPIIGTNDWQEVRLFFNTGNHSYINVMCYLHATTGEVWFDKFVLAECIDGTPPEVPVNFSATRINGTNKTRLSWERPSPAPDGDLPELYRIYWGDSPTFSLTNENLLKELSNAALEWIQESSPSTKTYYVITSIDKVGNQSDSTLVINVPEVSSISGKVVAADENKSPLAGAEVYLEELDLNVKTKEDGSFIFERLLPQQYSLLVRLKKYRRAKLSYTLSEGENKDFGLIQMQYFDIPPKAPTDIVVDGDSHVGLIKVSWDIPVQEDEDNIIEAYNVYRSKNSDIKREQRYLVATVEKPLLMDIIQKSDYGQTFYYQVEAINEAGIISDDASIVRFATVKAPPIPEPLSPINGKLVLDSKPEFTWLEVEDPDLVGYELQVSSDSKFPEGKIFPKECAMTASYEWHEVLGQKTWFWRIRAKFETGVLSDWSESGEFVAVNNQEGNALVPYFIVSPKALATGDVEINYLLTTGANITLRVYNLGGKLVANLQSGFLEAGYHSHSWTGIDAQARQLPNGLYFIQLQAEIPGQERVRTIKKLVIVR